MSRVRCPLELDNDQGMIFSSSAVPISGTVNAAESNRSYEIRISDKNANEVLRKPLGSDAFASFTWDLRSKSNSYVKSGCYVISLIDAKGIECCSAECKVADTRNILAITRSLKLSHAFTPLASVYFDIIEDIQKEILERLKDSRFDEPYIVACITAGFIQEIADDMQNKSKSRFLGLIAEFQSKNPVPEKAARLGLRALFDFVVNYMADAEDHVRASAMAGCGRRQLTQNDKGQIISSLVSAIYPHCRAVAFPESATGRVAEKIAGGIIKLGIRYVSAKHVNRSISICQTLPLGNPCDAVIR